MSDVDRLAPFPGAEGIKVDGGGAVLALDLPVVGNASTCVLDRFAQAVFGLGARRDDLDDEQRVGRIDPDGAARHRSMQYGRAMRAMSASLGQDSDVISERAGGYRTD